MAEENNTAFMQRCIKLLNNFLDKEFGSKRNWSDLGRRTDLDHWTVERILNGKYKDMKLSSFAKMVQGTGILSKDPDLILEILSFSFDDHSPDKDEQPRD